MRPWAERESWEDGVPLALKMEGPRAKVCGQPMEARFENNFQAQDAAAPAQGATIANRNLGNSRVPVNVPPAQRCRISTQPVPKRRATSELSPYVLVPSYPKQADVWPSQSDIICFPPPRSLFIIL